MKIYLEIPWNSSRNSIAIQYGMRFRITNIGTKNEESNFLYEWDIFNLFLSFDFFKINFIIIYTTRI